MRMADVRYWLIGAGWVLAIVSMPLRCCDLNGFLAWRGTVTTAFFVRWLFSLPGAIARDFFEPAAHGAMGGKLRATFDVAGLDLVWLGAVLVGFVLFAASVVIVRRVKSAGAAVTVKCVAPVLLVLPLTALAPAEWRYPLPAVGMWLLAAGQVLVGAGLMMTPVPGRKAAFEVEVKG